MFIHEFRGQFYDIIKRKKHALVLVNYDVDALCACKILMYLFECDHVKYSVLPVSGWNELRQIIDLHSDQNKLMILINCGGTRSLIDQISPDTPNDVHFYIIDSHRPFDLDNIYNADQVKILAKGEEVDSYPPAKEIYQSSSDDSDESDSGDSAEHSPTSKKRTRIEDIEKRLAKKLRRDRWKKRRGDLLWNYYENSWYSLSSALCMFELAHDLSKSTVELLWCAVVGVTSQYVHGLITDDRYINICVDRLRVHVKRFNHLADSQKNVVDRLRISFDKELAFPLYRHWSLYSSMEHDVGIICRLRLWTQKGARDMHHFLADLGLVLGDCEQLFSALSTEQRKDVLARLQTKTDKYKLTSAVFGSFIASTGYCSALNAADFARALCVQLEVSRTRGSSESNFFSALGTLNAFLDIRQKRRNVKPVQSGIETCKTFLEAIVREVYVAINQNHVLPNVSFLLVNMSQGPDLRFFTGIHAISTFAQFLLRAFITASANKFNGRPLVVAVPLSGENDGWYEVLGVMPLNTADIDGHNKSFIGRAFDRVCDRPNNSVRVERDHFDSCLIRLKAEDRGRFFNALQAVLETV